MNRIILIGWAALAPAGLVSAAASDNALVVLDASLAEAAQNDPHWRTEVRAESAASTMPAGRMPGRSPILGRYSYRARTYADLRPDERARWIRSPAFRRFLTSRFPQPNRRMRFTLAPEEMLQSRPFQFNVPPP